MGRKQKGEYAKTIEAKLPEGWEILMYHEGSDYAVVKLKIGKGDLERVRLLKLPEEVREYLRQKQRKYRQKLKKRNKRSTRKEAS